jgi:hypothetical protein
MPMGVPSENKPKARPKHLWPKGVSGNPGGRPKKKPITEMFEKFGFEMKDLEKTNQRNRNYDVEDDDEVMFAPEQMVDEPAPVYQSLWSKERVIKKPSAINYDMQMLSRHR